VRKCILKQVTVYKYCHIQQSFSDAKVYFSSSSSSSSSSFSFSERFWRERQ
jgi:hypothetical protein